MGFYEVDKVLYVVSTFFIGSSGVRRFPHGQVGIGILMLLCNWMTLGLQWLIDFVIALVKLGQYSGDKSTFDANGDWAYMQQQLWLCAKARFLVLPEACILPEVMVCGPCRTP